jgi:flagellar biosynthetic protein FlhB
MADEQQQQDRTEKATPKRREDARKKGDVPRSRELTMTGVMLSGATFILFLSAPIAEKLVNEFGSALSIERRKIFDPEYMPVALAEASINAAWTLAPFAIVLLVAVFASATLIGGWSFSMKAAAFKAEKMNPLKGIKRIFSANSLMELIKALAKFGIVAAIAVAWLWYSVDEVLMLGRQPIGAAISNAMQICAISLLVTSAGLILIAMADVPFQLWNYQKKLKMTRTEIRDEIKESEGRPEVKSKIRALQQQIATRRMMQDVPTADVIITNPTHYSIALKYDDSASGAPRVVAKGKDLIAAKIREIAEHNGVAIFSAPPLARALFRSTKIGHEIPTGLYTAVAQVLAYIFQIRDGVLPGMKYPDRPVPQVDESEF